MNPGSKVWHLVTGEYPPVMGGVADYCRAVAEGLADREQSVHVWTNRVDESAPSIIDEPRPGLTVHREMAAWKPRHFARLGRLIDAFEPPRRIFVQYAPNAFHRVGLNFALPRWLRDRGKRGDHIHLMFHEVTYLPKPGDPPRRRVLAFIQRGVARRLLGAADRVDIAIPYWEQMLRPLDSQLGRPYRWLPVASNIPVIDDPVGVAAVRRRLDPSGSSRVIGSFGTFAADVVALLAPLPSLLRANPDCVALLIGRGGERVVHDWSRLHPELAGRLMATGPLDHDAISRHLQACDLLIQPFPGGASSKRGSLMAGLAHGVATVTTSGQVTESIWTEAGACALADEADAPALIELTQSLLNDRGLRARVACSGRALYDSRFAFQHTIDALIAASANPSPVESVRS